MSLEWRNHVADTFNAAHASYHIKVSHKNPLIHFAHFSEGVVRVVHEIHKSETVRLE